jgi:hypothetical protein
MSPRRLPVVASEPMPRSRGFTKSVARLRGTLRQRSGGLDAKSDKWCGRPLRGGKQGRRPRGQTARASSGAYRQRHTYLMNCSRRRNRLRAQARNRGTDGTGAKFKHGRIRRRLTGAVAMLRGCFGQTNDGIGPGRRPLPGGVGTGRASNAANGGSGAGEEKEHRGASRKESRRPVPRHPGFRAIGHFLKGPYSTACTWDVETAG